MVTVAASMGPGRSWLAVVMLAAAVLLGTVVAGELRHRRICREAARDRARAERWARGVVYGGHATYRPDDEEVSS